MVCNGCFWLSKITPRWTWYVVFRYIWQDTLSVRMHLSKRFFKKFHYSISWLSTWNRKVYLDFILHNKSCSLKKQKNTTSHSNSHSYHAVQINHIYFIAGNDLVSEKLLMSAFLKLIKCFSGKPSALYCMYISYMCI